MNKLWSLWLFRFFFNGVYLKMKLKLFFLLQICIFSVSPCIGQSNNSASFNTYAADVWIHKFLVWHKNDDWILNGNIVWLSLSMEKKQIAVKFMFVKKKTEIGIHCRKKRTRWIVASELECNNIGFNMCFGKKAYSIDRFKMAIITGRILFIIWFRIELKLGKNVVGLVVWLLVVTKLRIFIFWLAVFFLLLTASRTMRMPIRSFRMFLNLQWRRRMFEFGSYLNCCNKQIPFFFVCLLQVSCEMAACVRARFNFNWMPSSWSFILLKKLCLLMRFFFCRCFCLTFV